MTSIFSKPELVWFIIGLVLFLLELVLPGFVIFFFGVGAWVTTASLPDSQPGHKPSGDSFCSHLHPFPGTSQENDTKALLLQQG